MGVWTFSQIIGFSLILLFACLLNAIPFFKRFIWIQAIYSLLAGYLYGFVLAVIDTQIYGLTNFWAYYLAGLSFDTLHGLGNFGFYILLAPVFQRLMNNKNNQKKRL